MKKTWLVGIGCLILGLAAGYFCAQVQAGYAFGQTLAGIKMVELGESGHRAYKAYQQEIPPVAIYALKQNLAVLKEAEEIGETPFVSKEILAIDLMLAHARLAKLYTEMGQTNLSSQHMVDALNYAKIEGKFPAITNQEALTGLLAKFDKIKIND